MGAAVPFGFLMLLLGFAAAALVFVIILFVLKQKRLHRLRHPKHDYLKKKK